VAKLLLPAATFVQSGDHVLTGEAKLVPVSKYNVPAPVFVPENVRLVPETVGLPMNFKAVGADDPATTVTFTLKLMEL